MKTILLPAFLLASMAAAQQPTEPPTFIRTIRTLSRDHEGANLARPYAKAQAAATVIGGLSITGMPESWLIETHDSFASIEEMDRKVGDAVNSYPSSNTFVGLYLPNLSYRPDQAVRNLPGARYLNLTVYRILPGTDSSFADLLKARRHAFDALNLDRPEMAFRVVSGANATTYLLIAPLQSLRMMDNGIAKNPAYAEAISEGTSGRGKLAADTVMSRESLLLRVEPRMSFVPDEFAASDLDFWRGTSTRQ